MANKNKSKSGSNESNSSKANDPVVHKAAAGHEDDLIIVPRERSRFYYLLMLGLMMFTLLIFTVGGLFETVIGGGGGSTDEVVLRWTEPSGEEHELKASEYLSAKSSVSLLTDLGFYLPVNGVEEGIDEEDVVLTVILDELAISNGVEVPIAEFRTRVMARGFDKNVLANVANNYRRPQRKIEEELMRGLRIQKLSSMVYALASLAADPEEVVQRWQENNPEYQLQVVELTGESYLEQAKTEVPSDEELTEWFHARPAFEQRQLFTEEKLLPVVAYVNLESDYDLTNLLDRYLAPEEWDEALQAQTYYNRYTTTRFKRPEEPKEEEGESESEDGTDGEAEEVEQEAPLYFTFEEVEEKVKREANVARALGQFATDYMDRVAKVKTNPDLAMPNFQEEAISMGLEVYVPDDLITRTETLENPDWGGAQTANQLGFLGVDAVTRQAVVNENSMLVAKINKKVRPQEPPFADIRDEVADMWAEARSKEIAQEMLRGIYDQFAPSKEDEDPENPEVVTSIDQPVVVDSAAFSAAVTAAGLTIIERPFLGRGEAPSDDPEEQTDLDRHLRSQPMLYTMEEGALAPPAESFTKEATYLVRLAEQRDPDPSGIEAIDLLSLRQTLRGESAQQFREEAFNPKNEAFRAKFKVWLKYWDDPDEPEDDSNPGA